VLLRGPGLRGQKRHAREDGIPTLPAGHLSPPRFDVYRAVSAQIMAIFKSITVFVEPLSMDEAYLEITSCVSDFLEALQLACTAAEKENIWASSWVCSGVSSSGRERVNQMMRRTENTSCEVDCPWVAQRAAKGKEIGFAGPFTPLAWRLSGEKHFFRKRR
jgi:impB/mucB/samB family